MLLAATVVVIAIITNADANAGAATWTMRVRSAAAVELFMVSPGEPLNDPLSVTVCVVNWGARARFGCARRCRSTLWTTATREH